MSKAPNKIRVNGQVYVKADQDGDEEDEKQAAEKRILSHTITLELSTKRILEKLRIIRDHLDNPTDLISPVRFMDAELRHCLDIVASIRRDRVLLTSRRSYL